MHQANADSIGLYKNVRKVFQGVVEGGAELAATQTRQWDKSRELANQLQGSLQNMKNAEVNALLSAIHSIHYQIVSWQDLTDWQGLRAKLGFQQTSNELVSSLHDRQTALDKVSSLPSRFRCPLANVPIADDQPGQLVYRPRIKSRNIPRSTDSSGGDADAPT